MTIYKNIHMSLCIRPICYHTFVNCVTHSASTKIRETYCAAQASENYNPLLEQSALLHK